ncbi:Lar family restriction alleviation protein [Pseudomonas sp. M1]|uniref:Lar family restriction alleviation protein n=1 Tax=Pseudomonas sp. (strain M1) TaxID=95619 RepID=UPI0002A360DF|nr:Lar family restriction alleviation protein [Pseudomonas sp. M1]UNY90617.1 Lar family restriction alleviation protein [Pseudomonas sp. M1]
MSELKDCPFCGAKPESKGRPASPNEDVKHVWFIACFCGGYSATAHQMGSGETAEAAQENAASAWNRRAIPADRVLVPRELLARVEESLRCEIEAHYSGVKDHPAIRPKYLRDIAEADELRALLQP